MSREKRVSDIKRAEDTEGVLVQTHIGGQALLEGIMMRGKYNWAVAVRTPEGDIYTEEHDLATRPDEHSWLNWPIIRGCRALIESLTLGYKALDVATEHGYDLEEEEEEEERARREKAEKREKRKAENAARSGKAVEACEQENPASGTADMAANAAAVHADEALESEDARLAMATLEDDDAAADAASAGAAASHAAKVHDSATFSESKAEGVADSVTSSKDGKGAKKAAKEKEEDDSDDDLQAAFMIGTVLGVVLGVAVFIMLPAFLSNLVVGNYNDHPIIWNIFDGLVRVGIFILYMWLISFMKDIKRMFRYHGAEHKTIHCYEHGLELTPENARQFTTLHVRCGTAFTIMTLILAIIVYSMIPLKQIFISLGVTGGVVQYVALVVTRILLMPLIAGIAYEITVKWAGAHPDRKSVQIVLWPGLQMQKLTTAEPDDSMLECAIAAMKIVLAREEAEEAKKRGETVDAGEGTKAASPSVPSDLETVGVTPVVESFSRSAEITTAVCDNPSAGQVFRS